MMKIGGVATLAFWCLAACSSAAPEAPLAVAVGTAFTLPVGGTAQVGQTGVRVGVEAVSADSRCPKGAQCVWAGQASVRVWLQQGRGDRQTLDLHLPAMAGPPVQAFGHQVQLLQLDPLPVSGKPIARADYRATLLLLLTPPDTPAAISER
ncbi:hypothetical protein RQP53_20490 [Paucibacter sp. APW11]|uniref:DUF3426 domain-containing protein n=1 Tax=Roseateles aquae TaxID=3077235 RepID=A0ABU3PGD7_9BURK|nr:hypothetical protein [Paucibacter sp. APW11]MDT9001667.1 hypothetical protein [Paucibacter sp. APW11]